MRAISLVIVPPATGNRAHEDLVAFQKQEIRRLGTDVQYQRAAVLPLDGTTDRVGKRKRTRLNAGKRKVCGRRQCRRLGGRFLLRRENQYFQLAFEIFAQLLVVPDNLVEAKRQILRRFLLHQLVRHVGRPRRQLLETRKDRLTRQQNRQRSRFDAQLRLERGENRRKRRQRLGPVRSGTRLDRIADELRGRLPLPDGKLRQCEFGGADIQRQNGITR